VLVVDDEPLAREGLRALLQAESDVAVVGECTDGNAALEALQDGNVEIVFLDVQMPGMNGFDVLAKLDTPLPVVVFVTAHDTFAIRAFDANALDFVVKPFSDERFRTAMARARRQAHERRLGSVGTELAELVAALRLAATPTGSASEALRSEVVGHRWVDRIPVRSVGRVVYVRVVDIMWIGSADYYVELHTLDGKSHLVRESMQRIEERLDPSRFMRTHRTAIVNLNQVAELRTDGTERHIVVLRNGARVPLGKTRRDTLERALANR
jgi:two-component system LytT family response regulator